MTSRSKMELQKIFFFSMSVNLTISYKKLFYKQYDFKLKDNGVINFSVVISQKFHSFRARSSSESYFRPHIKTLHLCFEN
jgi:hypothetical protein